MKTPARPPDWRLGLLEFTAANDGPSLIAALSTPVDDSLYLPWDKLRFKTPPAGLSHHSWWALVKMNRAQKKRTIALRAKSSEKFTFVLTDELLRMCMEITERSSGRISLPEQIATEGQRDRYVVSSLIEEAITSSQLEGAATSRRVAKQMIRSGREPLNRSERMILNNYHAMRRIQEVKSESLSPELVAEVHRIVTDGTLDNPADAGQIQTDDEERVSVWGDGDQLLYTPPPVSELPSRLAALCDFANNLDSKDSYLPAPLRSIVLHFMMGYDHYFSDGNGRTARAVFYWSMLHQGYWLTEYITISRILKQAPSRYAGSFLLTEDDEGDLTHFLLYHARVIIRALDDLELYLLEKAQELRHAKKALSALPGEFNHRQLAILDLAMREPSTAFTALSHSMSHNVSGETARKDLADLESRGLLDRARHDKKYYWTAVANVAERLSIQE